MWTTPRQYPRFKATLPVELRPIGLQAPLRAQTEDISLGGFYVEMTFTQRVSTELNIALWIGDDKIKAKGVVVSDHPAFGNGIKFTQFSEADKEALQPFSIVPVDNSDPVPHPRMMSLGRSEVPGLLLKLRGTPWRDGGRVFCSHWWSTTPKILPPTNRVRDLALGFG